MEIVKLLPKDINNIFDIFCEQFTDDLWSKKDIEDCFNNKFISFYGIKQNGNLVCIANILESVDNITLLKIATKNEYKRKGHAKYLLSYLISLKNQEQSFSLEVKSLNSAAIKLYESLGFKTLHIRKRYYKNGDDALCMFLNN